MAVPTVRLRAQTKLPVVGILVWGPASGTYELEPLRRALENLGYVNGKTITLLYRYSDFSPDRAAAQAHELVRLRVNVIVALATPSGAAASRLRRDAVIGLRRCANRVP